MIKRLLFETEKDWLAYRKKVLTASEINRIMAEPTKKAKDSGQLLSDGAISYLCERAASYFDSPKPIFYNAEMQWGKDAEPEAALTLCERYGYDVTSNHVIYSSEGGFVFYTDGIIGGTPDLILPDAIAEIKCPNSDTQVYYKRYVNVSNFQSHLPKYYDQIQTNMYLCDRDKCIFMSYDPRFIAPKDKYRENYIIILRDEKRIAEIKEKATIAFQELESIINK